jgi:hypothetical protein
VLGELRQSAAARSLLTVLVTGLIFIVAHVRSH